VDRMKKNTETKSPGGAISPEVGRKSPDSFPEIVGRMEKNAGTKSPDSLGEIEASAKKKTSGASDTISKARDDAKRAEEQKEQIEKDYGLSAPKTDAVPAVSPSQTPTAYTDPFASLVGASASFSTRPPTSTSTSSGNGKKTAGVNPEVSDGGNTLTVSNPSGKGDNPLASSNGSASTTAGKVGGAISPEVGRKSSDGLAELADRLAKRNGTKSPNSLGEIEVAAKTKKTSGASNTISSKDLTSKGSTESLQAPVSFTVEWTVITQNSDGSMRSEGPFTKSCGTRLEATIEVINLNGKETTTEGTTTIRARILP
jgi:hypothetical protein